MADSKIVAIHQPNFFPWLGYFNKIARSDLFILMDNAQFPKTGGNWSNRVRLMINGEPQWVTVPVVRAFHGVRSVRQTLINNNAPWRVKLIKTLKTNYNHAPFFESVFTGLEELINNPTDSLADYNTAAITSLAAALRIDSSKLVLGSSLQAEGSATDLLISMIKAVGGTAYLAGGGASGYQEDEKFAAAGIQLIRQDFQHPSYAQTNSREFVPGLSIIDALMNCGFEHAAALVSSSTEVRP
ncbi:MAG: WbqC family protein [Pyrinomonadaceae bacterium]|nr:WbqC family protein [Pyrinomonadaceae bacterium]